MPANTLDRFGRVGRRYPKQPTLARRSAYDRPPEFRLHSPRIPPVDEMARMLPRERHRHLLADSRHIYKMPLVKGAVHQKAHYVNASGWRPVFTGADEEWGKLAEAALIEADKLADVRGAPYTFDKLMEITCRDMDRSGDSFWVLTETAGGFPQFQLFEAHRVGQRDDEERVEGGKYRGRAIYNGIIYSPAGAPLAYRILGSTPEEDRDVAATDIIHAFDPEWFSDGRPFPAIATGLRDWYQVGDIRDAELVAQKVNSYLTLIESNEPGKRDTVNALLNPAPVTTNDPQGAAPIDVIEKGMMRYIKSGSGSITAHTSNRPSKASADFERVIVASALYGLGWRIEMMDLSLLGGAGVRGFQDNINTAIKARWLDLCPVAKRARLYQIAKLIKRGDIPENAEWWRWAFTPPPEFTVDPNRDVKSDIEALRAGIDSEANIIRRMHGMEPEAFYRLRARTLKAKERIAAQEGIDVDQLGTLALPGDQLGEPQEDEETLARRALREETLAEVEEAKSKMDAYGVGVRAGAITPQGEDESAFRAKLAIPAPTAAVQETWKKEPTRRPITLALPGEGTKPTRVPPPPADSDA